MIVDENGNPWWIAKEVCNILGLANVAMAVRGLDDDEKNTININDSIRRRGNPMRTIINEPGFYNLISKSTKPEAKVFSRWIRRDVLPSIRKTGSYSVQPKIEEAPSSEKILKTW
jgi:anti-repressor protein